MAWRDRLLRASFRGVHFEVEDHETEAAGRRVQVHEYPGRDEPYAEDLGRRTTEYNIEAYVIGDDYAFQRDRLVDACAEAGAGTLVHPYLGTRRAVCTQCTVAERTAEGRMARLSLAFVDAGRNAYPAAQPDTATAVDSAAAAANAALQERFAQDFVL